MQLSMTEWFFVTKLKDYSDKWPALIAALILCVFPEKLGPFPVFFMDLGVLLIVNAEFGWFSKQWVIRAFCYFVC
jgi:hypothetical protein